jgi:hypothetical protein
MATRTISLAHFTVCLGLLTAARSGFAGPGPRGAGQGGDSTLAWTVVPGVGEADEGRALSGLGGTSETDLWACGSFRGGGGRHTLVQHWDGSQWSIVPSPDGPRQTNWVTGIAAVDVSDVWMIGYSTDRDVGESLSETLIERWNGRAWSMVPSPNLSVADVSEEFGGYEVKNELFAIAVASKDDVWAVGRSYTIVRGQELIVHWDGQSWSVVPGPHPGVSGWLRGVLVVSRNDVWAFGEHYVEVPLGGDEGGTGLVQQNLIQHWDGSSWSVVPSPNASPVVNGLHRAAAVSANDIWVVGYHLAIFGVNQVTHPTILHWDGASWSDSPVPMLSRENTYLYSIVVLGADDAMAVGFYDTGPPFPKIHTLVERWNGLEWSLMQSLDPGEHNYLYAALAVFPDDIWAVGEMVEGEIIDQTLIERYTTTCPGVSFLRGDSNGDGKVDLSDAVATLSHLFLGGAAPACFDAADADDGGTLVITDAIFLLGALFLGTKEIPAPFPDCGTDPTFDKLECGQGCHPETI